ncbi:hypothetical protein ACFU3E_30685 [Streptomyces sp. NPDC057424]|uniref:hypothetical protein n=1 Tax=Streptomyces sp. NPDC057424 TaxID=3346127 RepID=UPI00368D9509
METLWVREDQRHSGWGSGPMRAAETEAARRGCTDMTVSPHSCQAPGFHPRLGHRERRIAGVPGGHEDVCFHRQLLPPKDETAGGPPA